jgi:hypothetical protein
MQPWRLLGLTHTSSSLINTSRASLLNSSREASLQSSPSSHHNPNPPPPEPIRRSHRLGHLRKLSMSFASSTRIR